ncbi:LicD family protein [Lentisphaera marina]|uniref:LicD family protein n=1 Tax=Lentisphaera marina TaxID=1111041 RepID=UPI00236539E0|nr:LicD family protein [Lentisphaera marina]MDD7986318.1 LicD family protein [Lentisphaera marina]
MIKADLLRKAQLIMLDMLIEFDAVCKQHALQYWLDSGTLLGAVRHQGFIPWDDDIDISMPLEDYLKFLEIGANELSDKIYLQASQRDPDFKFDYIKLRSNQASIVEFHEKDQSVNYHQGVFVDIFPMLNMDKTEENLDFYKESLKQIRELSSISLHTPNGLDKPKERAELVKALKQKHLSWKQSNTVVIYGGEMPDVAAYFDLAEVFPLGTLSFEGINFPVPKNPSHYLDAIYSFDYRQLPPENQRKIHAHSITLSNGELP